METKYINIDKDIDIEKIKEASIEELSSVEGMTQKTAEEVFRFFHKK